MNIKHRLWLYFLILYSALHLVRDVQQDLGIDTFLSQVLVKKGVGKDWTSYVTYVIALIEIALSAICLKRNVFGYLGLATMFIAGATLLSWLYIWFFR